MRRPKVPILPALFVLALLVGVACGDDTDGAGDDPEPSETSLADGDELDLDGAARLTVGEPDVQVAVGDLVVVELSENQSVGDLWQVTEEPDGAVLDLVDESYEIEGEEGCAGCGGTAFFVYEAVGDGGATFTLGNCFRCTSEGEPSEPPPEPAEVTFTVEVTA